MNDSAQSSQVLHGVYSVSSKVGCQSFTYFCRRGAGLPPRLALCNDTSVISCSFFNSFISWCRLGWTRLTSVQLTVPTFHHVVGSDGSLVHIPHL